MGKKRQKDCKGYGKGIANNRNKLSLSEKITINYTQPLKEREFRMDKNG